MSVLRTRTITGIIFAAVMISGIFLGKTAFALLFGLITGMCIWEFMGLTLPNEPFKLLRQTVAVAAGVLPYCLIASSFLGNVAWADLAGIAMISILSPFLLLFFFSWLLVELFLKAEKPFDNLGHLVFSWVYLAFPFTLLAITILQGAVYQPIIVMGMLLLVWANDSFAYLVGSQIGRTKLFPRISPGKTWEGSLGGVLGCMLAAVLLHLLFDTSLRLHDWLILGVFASVFGTLGDLVESMLKRSLGVKDSGTLLPGHGGMLDRFDAFIFMLPFACGYLLLTAAL